MKKVVILSLVAILMSSPVVFAQSPMYPGMGMKSAKDMAESMKLMVEMMLLYKFLGQPSLVTSNDNVYVLFGNKISQYDKDLNLVREVTLSLDVSSTREMVSKLAESYSGEMMEKMMGGMEGASKTPAQTGTTTGTVTDTTTETAPTGVMQP